MIPAAVEVKLDEQFIKEHIQKQLDEHLRHEYIFVDIDKLAAMCNVSKSWLERELLHDPRIRVHLRQKNQKRLWVYPEVMEAIKQVASEW